MGIMLADEEEVTTKALYKTGKSDLTDWVLGQIQHEHSYSWARKQPFLVGLGGNMERLGWVTIAPVMGADEQSRVQVQAESWIQWLRERAAKGVQENYCVWYTVERQRSFLPFQKHTNPRAGWCSYCGFTVVVPGSVSSVCTPQPPRVLVPSQQAGFPPTFASDPSVGDTDINPSSSSPLHLPVARTTELALPAQDLSHRIKALRVRGVWLGLLATVGTLGTLKKNQGGVGCVRVQGQTTWTWRIYRKTRNGVRITEMLRIGGALEK